MDPEVFNVAGDSLLLKANEVGRKLVKSLASFIFTEFNGINFPVRVGLFLIREGLG